MPVPPTRPERRFQPVPLLAKGISDHLGAEMCADCVQKTKETPELKTVFDYGQRLEHLRGAYRVATEKTKGRDILVIDDLFRSGATLEAIASTLRAEGRAQKVFVFAFTRTRSNR